MPEKSKHDIVILQGQEYLVATVEGPDNGRYSTSISPGANGGGSRRLYYKAHASDADALAAHRRLVEDINRGAYQIADGRFIRSPYSPGQ